MAEDKTRGQIDLNSADLDTIAQLPMVGEKRAHFIVDHRPYESWDDLRKVPGLSEGMINDLKNSNATLGKK
jgi:DNA uptake protein ComE-like DNA-binding protein